MSFNQTKPSDIFQNLIREMTQPKFVFKISTLKRDLSEKEENLREKFDLFKHSLETENRDLTEQLGKLSADHEAKLERLNAAHATDTKQMLDSLIAENEVIFFMLYKLKKFWQYK